MSTNAQQVPEALSGKLSAATPWLRTVAIILAGSALAAPAALAMRP